MRHWQLDNGASSLLLSEQDGRLCWHSIGPRLPDGETPASAVLLTEPVVAHGELDRAAPMLAWPTWDGAPRTMPAMVLRRDAEMPVDLVLVDGAPGDGTTFGLRSGDGDLTLDLTLRARAAGVWEQQVVLTNLGSRSLTVDWLASGHLPLPPAMTRVQHSQGFWANEFQPAASALDAGRRVWESDRGRSGHGSSASLLFTGEQTSEDAGPAMLVALLWPGNHRLQVAHEPHGGHAVQLGLGVHGGELVLGPGDSLRPPPLVFSLSHEGLNGLRRQMHGYWRSRESGRTATRPVHFNSWEAAYFDHDMPRMRELVARAADLGAERFVLDDGWMAGRTGPGVGLGDWRPCPERYPDGLAPLAEAARHRGLEFGLWIEPEMVTLDSDLARRHPEWIVGYPGAAAVSGRGQYLLDLTRDDVGRYISTTLDRVVEESAPDYLKWDMNRDYAGVPVRPEAGPLAMTHAFISLVEDFRRRHPRVALEICGAGGGRCDAATMGLADRLWPSDSLDPLQRFSQLRTASLLLPPWRLGWHVGAGIAETSGAATSLSTRCALALLGHLGLELDPDSLGPGEAELVARWVARFREHREWLAGADLLYLDAYPPDQTGRGAHAAEGLLALSRDGHQGLLVFLQTTYPAAGSPPLRRVPGLRNAEYSLRLLNPEDCQFAQHLPPWMGGDTVQTRGETLRSVGLRQPPLRYGCCAVVSLQHC